MGLAAEHLTTLIQGSYPPTFEPALDELKVLNTKSKAPPLPDGLPLLLRHTRSRYRVSQLDLALLLGVSQRHVSYLESGRARPSRALLLAWMKAVDAPASTRNAALLQAGFAVASRETREPEVEQGAARSALHRVITAHNPFPAFVFTIDRMMHEMNSGARWMWHLLMPDYWPAVAARGHDMDMIDAIIDPRGLFSRMRGAHAAGLAFLGFLRSEEWMRPTLRPRADALAAELQRRFGDPPPKQNLGTGKPQLNFDFDTEHGPLSFVLVQSVFGLPQDITVDSPRIELWFAADSTTRQVVLEHAPPAP